MTPDASVPLPAPVSDGPISLIVNGRPVTVCCSPHDRLIDVLRNQLGLTGTKEGCGVGECGACSVLLDGELVNSCLVLAHAAAYCSILTIEGLAPAPVPAPAPTSAGAPDAPPLHPLQQAFIDAGAVQCGFCTPGLILASKALLDQNPRPSREEIQEAISGNLCRCTGYEKVIQAVQDAARGLEKPVKLS